MLMPTYKTHLDCGVPVLKASASRRLHDMRAVVRVRSEPYYRRQAIEDGLRRVGFTVVDKCEPNGPEDWVCTWNRKKGTDEQFCDAWEAKQGTVVVLENGYLAKTEKTHYALSVHGHNGSGWFPVGDEDRFTPLGFELKPQRLFNFKEIVIREQRGIGSTLMASPPNWARKTLGSLQNKLKMPFRIAPHPGDKNKAAIDAANLKNAAALVTWSSAMGVRALVEGVPVFYAAPHWICSEGAQRVEFFPEPGFSEGSRKAALRKMSHGQWHFDEIASGEPFARIIANREKASW
jgi:hypothetical protein